MESRVVLHVDGGAGVGLGHVSRGLGLAAALRRAGLIPRFAVDLRTGVLERLAEAGEETVMAAADAESLLSACRQAGASVLVIDSYRLDGAQLERLTAAGLRVACFDDAAQRSLPVALVINAAPHAERMPSRTAAFTRRLFGPAYQVLRPEFTGTVARDYAAAPRRLLVTVGGDDRAGYLAMLIEQLLGACRLSETSLVIDAVIGPFAPALESHALHVSWHRAPALLRPLMLQADLAISAGGQTLYELVRCGVPTIAWCLAEDQRANVEGLAAASAVWSIGASSDPAWRERVCQALDTLLHDGAARARLGRGAAQLLDGRGADRIAHAVASLEDPCLIRGSDASGRVVA